MNIFWAAFSGAFVAFIVISLIGSLIEVLYQKRVVGNDINKKNDENKEDNDEEFYDLLTEFDEMGYTPTTLCEEPEKEAKEYKNRLIEWFNRNHH